MRKIFWTISFLLMIACSSTSKPTVLAKESAVPPEKSIITPNTEVISTMIAIGQSIEVTFDGSQCTMTGSPDILSGSRVIIFHNLSSENAYLYVGRNNPGITWQDILRIVGTPPGNIEPPAKDFSFVSWEHKEALDAQTYYEQFQFKFPGEYHIVVQGHGEFLGFWPCGPFFIK